MPLRNQDPAHWSKSRLKSDLVAHNVALPPANSRKDVYVELHCRHIGRQRAVDFSSDEDDQEDQEPEEPEGEDPGDTEVPDPCVLTDHDLMAALLQHGFKAGPIVASTRALYEKKLRMLRQAAGRDGRLNGVENGVENGGENGVLFSDSEDELEGSEGAHGGTVELLDQSQQEGSQMESRMSLATSKDTERELSGSKVQEDWSWYDGLDSSITDTVRNRSVYYTPEAFPRKSEKKVPAEPVHDVLKDLFPDTKTTPSGIYATRRRPIKGAASRPIKYKYPDTPTSPTTLERREVERRLVPIHIQILLFLILVVLLYFIYALVEDGSLSSLNGLLDYPDQGSDNGERLLGQGYSQDAPALSGHE